MIEHHNRRLSARIAVGSQKIKQQIKASFLDIDNFADVEDVDVITRTDGRELLPVERDELPILAQAAGGGN